MKELNNFMTQQKVVLTDKVMQQSLVEESVLLDLEQEKYFGLDSVASKMLIHLQQAKSIDLAYRQLVERFEVDPKTLRQDLHDFIAKMVDYGLIEVVDA